jgi:hypothetical protein
MEKGRTLRFDISSSIYPQLERHAQNEDMGVPDLVRRIIIDWVKANPGAEIPA